MDIISANNLSKHFGEFKAVDNLSFTVKKGEIFGFLGPNGAGKSTTINMLIGLVNPSAGSIEIAGFQSDKDIKKIQAIIGVVPDESNLYDDLSGFENLVFVASLYGIDRKTSATKAMSLLETFDLIEAKDRPFKAYSKGMKRKLTLAAGIIHDPTILFLDEPTTGIDVMSARKIREMIKELNNQGTTVFMTTHYIEDAQRLCDRIGFIVAGRIVEIASLASLMATPHDHNILQITSDSDLAKTAMKIPKRFPGLDIIHMDKNTIQIKADFEIDLVPLLGYLSENGHRIREARLITPTLEDVFVKITGTALAGSSISKGGKYR